MNVLNERGRGASDNVQEVGNRGACSEGEVGLGPEAKGPPSRSRPASRGGLKLARASGHNNASTAADGVEWSGVMCPGW